eukprot:scpid95256/ scgid10399/ 
MRASGGGYVYMTEDGYPRISDSDCSAAMADQSKRTMRKFAANHDEALVKELLAGENQFVQPASSSVWSRIADSMATLFPDKMGGLAPRGARDRAEKLVRDARAKQNKDASASGIVEDFGPKEQALVSVVELYEVAAAQKACAADDMKKKQQQDAEMKSKAASMRDGAFSCLKRKACDGSDDEADDVRSSKGISPAKKNSAIGNMLEYLDKKHAADSEVKKEELALSREQFEESKKQAADQLSLQREQFTASTVQARDQLTLQRDQFTASEKERNTMLQLMGKMLDKLN